ncbi:uncharacterized protein TRIREDRAFT_109958 [Trichoderma reesei QM6a]|uniref:Predicted protein n=2 Tax=Hypocrea jecorina TaxID=51453 RepID=G0RQV0_HYPJQ|nr:uncharacterized protein TRIREDRAFT_109958 [Trichoderma reesei QM6a]EGR46324.1 predicted protein [Trichoderma reesei QM6a]ETR99573.1 hypothetical protein M419DRAFT_86255 [Trichoderma reesei RUT C-30]
MPNLPPALQVFPTLARYALRPRRLAEIPIGGPSTPQISAKALQQSAIHLYHDLGVLVWVGCSVDQVRRIGDVLRQVVAWGGQGGLVARLDAWEGDVVRKREEGLREGDLYRALDEKRTGNIKPSAVLRLATTRFEETLYERIPELKTAKDIDVRETQIIVPGSPPPRGIINKTVDGPRHLPIESFTTISVDRITGLTIGETRFFTVGSSNYVGGARVDYLILKHTQNQNNDSKGAKGKSLQARTSVIPYWGNGKLKQRRRASDEAQGAIFEDVVSRVMQPLWDIEGGTWADRAAELEAKREKKNWGEKKKTRPSTTTTTTAV